MNARSRFGEHGWGRRTLSSVVASGPFFIGPIWAVIALLLWLLAAGGDLTRPSAFPPLIWHRHEMLFGFAGAVIAGFRFQRVPRWC
ncbi:NnrS family protein [Sphingobium nicotianae]|uniref:NnrS family protein n=1 Tax=Sphingobium nicotianae TaxID=2782607 RepID=A0A9X1IR72_9SPHN|nr:NnrS family protein [Sphingobium nicotianae]